MKTMHLFLAILRGVQRNMVSSNKQTTNNLKHKFVLVVLIGGALLLSPAASERVAGPIVLYQFAQSECQNGVFEDTESTALFGNLAR